MIDPLQARPASHQRLAGDRLLRMTSGTRDGVVQPGKHAAANEHDTSNIEWNLAKGFFNLSAPEMQEHFLNVRPIDTIHVHDASFRPLNVVLTGDEQVEEQRYGHFCPQGHGLIETARITSRKRYFQGMGRGPREKMAGAAAWTDQQNAPSPIVLELCRLHDGVLRLILSTRQSVQRKPENEWSIGRRETGAAALFLVDYRSGQVDAFAADVNVSRPLYQRTGSAGVFVTERANGFQVH